MAIFCDEKGKNLAVGYPAKLHVNAFYWELFFE